MNSNRRRQLGLVWLGITVLLGALLLAAGLVNGPLDDPDMAYQRPGFLDPTGMFPASAVTADVPHSGRPAVIFFVRLEQLGPLAAAIADDPGLGQSADVVAVVSAPTASVPQLPVVVDTAGRLAGAYRLDRPDDGGPPVGYAVVDRLGQVRYQTLDLGLAGRLAEVTTILQALP